ncbi:MAG: tRNA pseudouridine(55) synthase TruB [Prevotella sp.]|jgi:tRNA pseudouridine55 synthase|nr:tRNA pseudouridine(55) synthase TruB [Prevotella sp.]
MNFVEGEILHINKPYGMSSFGALAFVRTRISKAVGVKRVKTGHAGTLDPLATGVLILCTGKCTKMIPTLQYHSKEYTATLQFGATTPSYDMEHPVNATFPTEHITEERIKAVLEQFKGDIMQVPPTYSAVKKNGDRAYELRRRGEDVKLDAKPVHIDDIELLWFDPEKMQAQIRVECGKGTYIRALARDIGRALDSGAYLTQLCRTRLGDVRIEDCIKLDDFQEWLDGVSTK